MWAFLLSAAVHALGCLHVVCLLALSPQCACSHPALHLLPACGCRRSLLTSTQMAGCGTAAQWWPTFLQRQASHLAAHRRRVLAWQQHGRVRKWLAPLAMTQCAAKRQALAEAEQHTSQHAPAAPPAPAQEDGAGLLAATAADFGLADRRQLVEEVRTQDWEQSIKVGWCLCARACAHDHVCMGLCVCAARAQWTTGAGRMCPGNACTLQPCTVHVPCLHLAACASACRTATSLRRWRTGSG